MIVGHLVDERLFPPVVHAIVGKAARTPGSAGVDGIRDVAALLQKEGCRRAGRQL